jgi:hypothetical protein
MSKSLYLVLYAAMLATAHIALNLISSDLCKTSLLTLIRMFIFSTNCSQASAEYDMRFVIIHNDSNLSCMY